MFFRFLQIAVVAPYIFKASNDTDSDYFRIGLKLVAGSLVILNARPLLTAAIPTIRQAFDLYLQQSGYQKTAPKVSETIDGEFKSVA